MRAATPSDPLVAAFERIVSDGADRVLAIGSGRIATASEIDALARTLEPALPDPLASSSRRIGLSAPNGPGFLGALVACLRRGWVPVLLDPAMTASEIDRSAAAIGFGELLRIHVAWPESSADHAVARVLTEDGAQRGLAGEAVIKRTSGSSGEPRGVAVRADALLADDRALRETMRIVPGDRLLAAIPFSHSYGLSSLVLPALVAGLPLILPDDSGPLAPLRAAEQFQASVFPTVPAWTAALTRLQSPPALPRSLRLVVVAGAAVSPESARDFRKRCSLPLHVFYGASECGGITYDATGDAAEEGDVGEPVCGVQIALEPAGAFGARVCVRSPAVALGYTPGLDSRLENGRFVSDDLACWNGTRLRLTGRADALINVRGLKVHPAEVERVIRTLGPVTEVVVDGFDGTAGGDAVVCAFVACAARALTANEVIAWCRSQLSDYKVPRRVVLVREIPRNARGKVDRAALQRLQANASGDV